MAENEAKKVIKTETSKKDVDKKEASSKKESKTKAPELPPVVQEWTKDAVQYGLKEWFRFFPSQIAPETEKELTVERKKEVKHLNQLYDWNVFIMSHLRDNSTTEINTFLDWLLELYVDPFKRDVKSYLVSNKMRKLFSRAYEQNANAMYPVLEKINQSIPVREYPSFSFDPASVLKGSVISKTSSERELISPLSNEDIISRLNLFVQNKNADVFTNWVFGYFTIQHIRCSCIFQF